MQVETRKIYVYHPTGADALAGIGIPAGAVLDAPLGKPAKQLIPSRTTTGYDKPTFQSDIKADELGEFQYFGKPYNFNTKYVVDCEADDTIGSHITLASGKTVWVDMTAESVNIACNRR